MRAEMKSKSLVWPRIGRSEIADMAAYLRTRQPAALKTDVAKQPAHRSLTVTAQFGVTPSGPARA